MTRRRAWRAATGMACLLGISAAAWAQGGFPTEEQYLAVQQAFLQEAFRQVVGLVQSFAGHAGAGDPGAILRGSAGAQKSSRVWLWYLLSLERLQRGPEALRELDRLKAALANAPPESAAQAGFPALWPEVLFWDGEISRKMLKMVRARLAYQRLLAEYPQSVWKAQAVLGLGLVLFHQQAYDAAASQVHDVARQASASPVTHEALLLEGMSYVQLKRFEEAAGCFRQLAESAADQESRRAQALFYLGEALTGLGRFEEAVGAYQQAEDADPRSRWADLATFGIGWSLFQQHRCRESLKAFERYEAHLARRGPQPNPAEASAGDAAKSPAEFLFARGRCFMELGQDGHAVQALQQLRREDPEHALAIDAALSLAELFQRQQRFADAMGLLDDVLRQAFDPEQVKQAHLRMGALRLAQGDAAQASAQFHLAKDSPDPAVRQSALNGLGDVQVLLGNAEEAEEWYDEAMRVSRTSPAGLYAVYQLGRLDLQADRMTEAIERFQWLVNRAQVAAASGLSSLPHQAARSLEADAHLALAFAYLSDAQPDAARAELEWVRGQEPRSPQAARANYYLALLALNDGRFSDAQALCHEVIDRVPDSDEALEARLLLADLLAARGGSPLEAVAVLQQAVGTLQGSQARHRGRLARKLGDLTRQAGDYAQAVHWYEQAWEDLPAQRGELDYRLASCYEEAGDLAVAAGRYRSIAQAPWQIRGQLAAAKLMEREERWEDAMTIYRFVTTQPVPEAKIAEERLSILANTN